MGELRHMKTKFPVIEDEAGDTFIVADSAHKFHICNVEGSGGKCYEYAHLMASAPRLKESLSELLEFSRNALSGTIHNDDFLFFADMATKALEASHP
jgi:hypothetical protein